MKTSSQTRVAGIMASMEAWVKGIFRKAEGVTDRRGADALEEELRDGLRRLGRQTLEAALQQAVDHFPEDRTCPRCGARRRHKGRRTRRPVSSFGGLVLKGVYWHCAGCGEGEHAATRLLDENFTGRMRRLLCLFGVSLASFAKAETVVREALGVRMLARTLNRLCVREGRRAAASPPPATPVPSGADLVVGCDGTMVHTRQRGWRELKVYRLEHEAGRRVGAALEPASRFWPRLRHAAARVRADQAGRQFLLSDAARWIERGAKVHLPRAVRIVDLWHATQHVYQAGEALYPEDEQKARRWGRRWSRRLRAEGGRVLRRRLERLRLRPPMRRRLKPLMTYLRNQGGRLDYPVFQARGWPLSSAPIESTCKQLGARLKGPGMRWNRTSVTPMATLASLWAADLWDNYWNPKLPLN